MYLDFYTLVARRAAVIRPLPTTNPPVLPGLRFHVAMAAGDPFGSPFHGDKGWSASRKFAALMAAGDRFFIDSCNQERLAMDAALTSGSADKQFDAAVATQSCIYGAYVSHWRPLRAGVTCSWMRSTWNSVNPAPPKLLVDSFSLASFV